MGGIEEFGPNPLRPGDERFRKFIELTAGQPPRGLLVRAAALVSGVALDLGSGAGGESLYLADQGFEVVAVDGGTSGREVPVAAPRGGCGGCRVGSPSWRLRVGIANACLV